MIFMSSQVSTLNTKSAKVTAGFERLLETRARLLGVEVGELAGDVDPRSLAAGLRVPGVAHKDGHSGLRAGGEARFLNEVRHTRKPGRRFPGSREVVEGGQRVRLAAAELGDQRQDRRSVVGLARQPAQNHAGVVAQCPCEAVAGEEVIRVSIVLRRRTGHDLLQCDGELVRVEGTALPDLLAWRRDLVPRLHEKTSYGLCMRAKSSVAGLLSRARLA